MNEGRARDGFFEQGRVVTLPYLYEGLWHD